MSSKNVNNKKVAPKLVFFKKKCKDSDNFYLNKEDLSYFSLKIRENQFTDQGQGNQSYISQVL